MMAANYADGMTQLRDEHQEMRRLFAELAATTEPVARAELILQLMCIVSAHEDVEASALGPVIRSRLVDGRRVSRSLRRHYHEIDRLLVEVERRSVFSPDMAQLLGSVSDKLDRLIADQEPVFGAIRDFLGPEELEALGASVVKARRHATTRPHPFLPRRRAWARTVRAGMARIDRVRNRMVTRL